MWPVSERFKQAVREGGDTWVAKAQVYRLGEQLNDIDMEVTGGTCDVDTTAASRRRSQLEIAVKDDRWIPASPTDWLYPTGNEIAVQAGFRYQESGVEELVPQGVFRISRPKVHEDDQGLFVRVDCYDRMRSVSRARFTRPYPIARGTPVVQAIKTIILRGLPFLDDDDFQFMDSDEDTPKLLFDTNDDPAQVALGLAQSIGAELFFNMAGIPVLRPEPDPSFSAVDWEYVKGEEATILEIDKDLDDTEAYNGCVVIGKSANSKTKPVRAEAWDTDPDSPTFYDPANPPSSTYGPVPFFIESKYVRTAAQALKAARAGLLRKLGALETVAFNAIPNPAHEGNDVIRIASPESKLDIVNVLESFRFDYALGGILGGTARQRRVTT